MLISLGCGKKEAKQEQLPTAEQKLIQMGAQDVKSIKTNKPTYDRMELEQRGKAYSFEMFQDRKISVETNYKGEISLFSPEGEKIINIGDKTKQYLPAKDGKYFLWLKNNAVPSEYYIIIKTLNKANFNADSDELPGTKLEQDGLITGVVDSITDPVDYFSFPVAADNDLRVYYESPYVDVVLMNKYKEETKVLLKQPANLFILDTQDFYLKVTPKKGKIGVPYEINLKRVKNAL